MIPFAEVVKDGSRGFETFTKWQRSPMSGQPIMRSCKITQVPTVHDLVNYTCGVHIRLSNCCVPIYEVPAFRCVNFSLPCKSASNMTNVPLALPYAVL